MEVTALRAAVKREQRRAPWRLPSPEERRAARMNAGLSTTQLAAILDVTPQTIRNWEAGASTPRGDQLETYLEALNVMQETA